MNALIQNGTNEHSLLLKMSHAIHMNYCEKWGIEYIYGFKAIQANHPFWDKVFLIRRWIRDPRTKIGDVCVWLDCDALWCSPLFNIIMALAGASDFGAVKGQGDYFNTGCIWVRCTEKAKEVLDRWYWFAQGNKPPPECLITFKLWDYGWYDQAAFNWIVQMEEFPGLIMEELDSRFNDYPQKKNGSTEQTVVKAFHAKPMKCTFRDFPRVLSTMPLIG